MVLVSHLKLKWIRPIRLAFPHKKRQHVSIYRRCSVKVVKFLKYTATYDIFRSIVRKQVLFVLFLVMSLIFYSWIENKKYSQVYVEMQ